MHASIQSSTYLVGGLAKDKRKALNTVVVTPHYNSARRSVTLVPLVSLTEGAVFSAAPLCLLSFAKPAVEVRAGLDRRMHTAAAVRALRQPVHLNILRDTSTVPIFFSQFDRRDSAPRVPGK